MTDLELKTKLAAELPELIEYIPFNMEGDEEFEAYFIWRDPRQSIVTSREWDWIVRECRDRYHKSTGEHYLHHQFLAANATWQQRAEAYFKAKQP